jgi:hypothetical protein
VKTQSRRLENSSNFDSHSIYYGDPRTISDEKGWVKDESRITQVYNSALTALIQGHRELSYGSKHCIIMSRAKSATA